MLPLLLLIALGASALLLSGGEAAPASKTLPAPTFDGPPKSSDDAAARKAFLLKVKPDADWAADGYSRHTYQLISAGQGLWVYSGADSLTREAAKALGLPIDNTGKFGSPVDEYGRPWHGVSGNPLGVALQAAGIALPFIPGVGPAASAALAAAVAWAKGESLKDAALKAARAAVPGGAAGQLAFDVGVAAASGAPIDEAATQALLEQIPGGEQAYQAGQDAWAMAQGMGA